MEMKKIKVLALMSFGHLVTHWYIGVLMIMLPLIKQEFALSFTAVGLLSTLRSWTGAAGNTTSGFISDFLGRRNLILILCAFFAGLCWFLVGFSETYLAIFILIPLADFFKNMWHAPAMSILSEVYPERKGFALGFHGAAANLGQSISPLVLGIMISYLGWRASIKMNIAPALFLAILVAIFLHRLGTFSSKKKSVTEFKDLLKNDILKNRPLLFISLISALRTMGQRGLEAFLGIYLSEQMGLNTMWVGVYLSILSISGTFPEPIIGWVSDRIGRKSILWVNLTVSGFVLIALTMVNPGSPLILCLILLGLSHYSLRTIIFSSALDVTPPAIGASTISYVFTWNHILSAISPILAGVLADALGIRFAFYFIALITFIAALLAYTLKPGKGRMDNGHS
ncbi:MAG: MFS transporter [Thermodesulfobacteriota bacterium]|nr:MFS transporter [Thermodesulfobacteriota bacterium]